ncbi:MAG: hypothetical protein JRN15_13710, partial [Nitrososphaerota archaeon]|nr:hypothetical protein [Nitrososphaerota archaeon]
MDPALFASTVPNSAIIGKNYTIEILVNNNSDQPVPILLKLNVPLNMINIRPFLVLGTVQPNSQFLANFTIVVFSESSQGEISISAVLSIWYAGLMSKPQVVQEISANIYRIDPSSYSQLVFFITGLGIASAVAITLFYIRFRRP